MSFLAAIWRALARLTEVSLTDHRSGFGGAVMILGPPGRLAMASRCLIFANLARAEACSSSGASGASGEERRRGGERDSAVGALGEGEL
jgi:hypothetical protein